jgi:hypothetical protein
MSNKVRIFAITAVIGAFVLSMLGYTASNNSSYNNLNDYYQQELSWSTCYDTFECAELDVPIDYEKISTGTFQISVLRYAAQDPKNRIGSLVINPGGPGASGVDYAYNAEYIFDPDLTDRFDIVGFDPRGVARSAPITCFNDAETDANYASDSKPDNEAPHLLRRRNSCRSVLIRMSTSHLLALQTPPEIWISCVRHLVKRSCITWASHTAHISARSMHRSFPTILVG